MRSSLAIPLSCCAMLAVACGGAPPPSERLAQAESADRAANELGAKAEPTAALHLKMAEDQIAEAKKLIADGENERADAVLLRAQADAELSVQLSKAAKARAEAAIAVARQAAALRGGAP